MATEGGFILKQSPFRIEQTVRKVSFELECELTLTENALTWKWQSPPPGDGYTDSPTKKSVRILWVLKAAVEENTAFEDKSSSNRDIPSKLVIHFVHRLGQPDFQFRVDQVTLHGPSSLCHEWVSALTEHLKGKAPQRPKSLLIIINPCSGGKKGEKMYNNDIAPIFKMIGAKTDVRVTAKAKDSFNILGDYDLSTVDGVVSVGGDGTHYEVIGALMEKTMKDLGVEELTLSTVLRSPSVRHGLIPAGTGNGGQLFASYSKDPVTNALVIALGDSKPRDLLTLFCGEKFLSTCFFGCAYGLVAQALDTMEAYKWAGPIRYIAGCYVGLIKHAPVNMVIDFQPDEPSDKKTANLADSNPTEEVTQPGEASQQGAEITAGQVRTDTPAVTDHPVELPEGWKRLEGKILEVDMFCYGNLNTVDLNRYYLVEHTVKSGCFSLVYSRPCGRISHMKFIGKMIQGHVGQAIRETDFVEVVDVRECKIRAVLDPGDQRPMRSISCDGETVTCLDRHYEVRCHAGLMNTFARKDGEELRRLCKAESSTSTEEK